MNTKTILNISDEYNRLNEKNVKTLPFITQYEKTKAISLRSQQISNGSKAMVPVPLNITDSYDIAKLEYNQKKIPYIIKRIFPDGQFENWKLCDLTEL